MLQANELEPILLSIRSHKESFAAQRPRGSLSTADAEKTRGSHSSPLVAFLDENKKRVDESIRKPRMKSILKLVPSPRKGYSAKLGLCKRKSQLS